MRSDCNGFYKIIREYENNIRDKISEIKKESNIPKFNDILKKYKIDVN